MATAPRKTPWMRGRSPGVWELFVQFMETYAQDLGFAPAAVAMRAGHDPSVMSKHDTDRIEEADRALATAVAGLIAKPAES